MPAAAPARDQLMLGDLRGDLRKVDHLPAFAAGLGPPGQARAARRTDFGLVPDLHIRNRDLLEGDPVLTARTPGAPHALRA
jgi:hypothetical protein